MVNETFFDKNKIRYTFNEKAANCLLTYYHLLRDYSIIKEVHKLLPGNYIVFSDKCTVHVYWKLEHKINHSLTEMEAIEKIDELFKEAVRLEFEKDKEYGYKHYVTLSGGLDSRMTCMIAYELGYKEQLAFHMCDGKYYEEKIARQIAFDLGIQYLYKMNSDGSAYMNPDKYLQMSYAENILGSVGESQFTLMNLDWSVWGGIHTGQLGDAVIGGSLLSGVILKKPDDKKVESDIVELQKQNWDMYKNDEEKNMYERGFIGCLSTHQYIQHFTEQFSPFLYPELIEFCFTIPPKMRYGSKLYIEWIRKKHPKEGEYIWEKIGKKPTELNSSREDVIRNIKLSVKKYIPEKALKVRREWQKKKTRGVSGMIPINRWYRNNNRFRNFIHDYYKSNISYIIKYTQTYRDCKKLFENGDAFEKMFVLTVLSAYKKYFMEK